MQNAQLTCIFAAAVALIFFSSSHYIYNEQFINNGSSSDVRVSKASTMTDINVSANGNDGKNSQRPHPWLRRTDLIYNHDRNTPPIVIEEYNLVFFLTAKAASTEFVRFFSRLENRPNWCADNIHKPQRHKLKFLSSYTLKEAQEIMTNPKWKKAIFVRHPKARILSAFLDKCIQWSKRFVSEYCTNYGSILGSLHDFNRCKIHHEEFKFFLQDITTTLDKDVHWRSIFSRIDEKWWPYIDTIGNMDTLRDDAQALLSSVYSNIDNVSAWDRIGTSGWSGVKRKGKDQNGHIADGQSCDLNLSSPLPFLGKGDAKHTTNANDKMRKYYTPELEEFVERKYYDDLNNPFFKFKDIKLFPTLSNEKKNNVKKNNEKEEIDLRVSKELADGE
jgi:hypothetical protein